MSQVEFGLLTIFAPEKDVGSELDMDGVGFDWVRIFTGAP